MEKGGRAIFDKRKRWLKAQAKAAEQQQLRESLPVEIDTLKDLLSYLNRDDAPQCNHTLRDTNAFLESRQIDSAKVIPWLQQHGGYCDCEVVYNVYDAVGDLVGWHLEDES